MIQNNSPYQPDTVTRNTLRLLIAIGGAAALLVWLLRRRQTPINSRPYPAADTLLRHPRVTARVVRHPNNALMVRWYAQAETIIVYGGASPDTIDTEEPLAVTSDVSSVTFNRLDPHKRYYFKIQFIGGAYNGTSIIVAEREIPLEGAVNFRDIGGYQASNGQHTTWGKIYRAGKLNELTETDRALLDEMKLQMACDLRTPEEVAEAPDRLPGRTTVVEIPVKTRESFGKQARNLMRYQQRMDEAMIDIYTRVGIDFNARVNGDIIRRMADPTNLPLVVHCTAGKDRTGIAIALLLAVLGVPDEVILADYSLSNAHFEVFEAIGKQAITPFRALGVTAQKIQPFFTADPTVMAATLAHVREKYGSAEQYLVDHGGVQPEEIARLRDLLLE